ncbi:tail fiber assembly protein [Phytobacter diazotrophicus]|uniref:tail fiber assembly protein n=1 Tax=Phytobacter diazotrophicus TaxID=395631 RepID=UPI0014527992|nr:tail fiber assembly protein [Phytobacter diazotrophicus]QJF18279.1 tail fiber assembly protein [Phytobacter diazotrophicus]
METTKNWAFSPSNTAFYSYTLKDLFDAAETWPTDAVDISDDVRGQFWVAPEGKILGAVDGMPVWVDAPPPTHEEAVIAAKQKKQALLDEATSKITIWQTKLLMGRKLSDSESAQLNVWMDYIDNVSAIEPETAPQINWPEKPSA